MIRKTILLQGIYFLFTGLWPLVSIASFMAVTGPKTDIWLVKTLALQISAMGIVLCFASLEKDVKPSVVALSILSAIGFIISDVYYVIKGVIPQIYLADAFVQIAIAFIISGTLLFRRNIDAGV